QDCRGDFLARRLRKGNRATGFGPGIDDVEIDGLAMICRRFDALWYFRMCGNRAEPCGASITPGERRPLRLGDTVIGFLQAASGKERRPVDGRYLWARSVMLRRNGLQMQKAPLHIQHE